MYKLIILSILATIVIADKDATILRSDSDINPDDGSYKYSYATSNGITAHEEGVGGVKVTGGAEYEIDGQKIKLEYIADENGFQPVGDHIPKIPEYIARALEYIRTHTHQEGPSLKV